MTEIHDLFEKATHVKGALTYETVKSEALPGRTLYVIVDKVMSGSATFAILKTTVVKLHETVIKGFPETFIEVTIEGKTLKVAMQNFNGKSDVLDPNGFTDKSRVFVDRDCAEEYLDQLRLTYEVMKEEQLGNFKGWTQKFKPDGLEDV